MSILSSLVKKSILLKPLYKFGKKYDPVVKAFDKVNGDKKAEQSASGSSDAPDATSMELMQLLARLMALSNNNQNGFGAQQQGINPYSPGYNYAVALANVDPATARSLAANYTFNSPGGSGLVPAGNPSLILQNLAMTA